jgi:photosystem II stability/assembly factor-like uncharacterized protein
MASNLPAKTKMKKAFFISLAALTLLSAACDFNNKGTAGILKTSNGGVDWQASNTIKASDPEATDSSMLEFSISKLAFDPVAPEILYASSYNAGLYKSVDGAATWQQILGQIPVLDFAVHPQDNQTIYAAGYFEGRGRVLLTRDGGKSWNAIYTSAANNTSVRSVALNPNSPHQVAIGLSGGELIMSDDAGQAWRLAQSYNDRINRIIWTRDAVYVVVRTTGVFKSTDGGASFQLATANLQSPGNSSSDFDIIFGSSIGNFNQLAVSESGSGVLFLTTNLGLYRSENAGNSWQFVSMPLRQSATPAMAVAISRSSDNTVYVSAGSIIYKTTDFGSTWSSADTQTNSLINALAVSPDLPQVAFAGAFVQ